MSESPRRPSLKVALVALFFLGLTWTVTRSGEGEGETKPKNGALPDGAVAQLGNVADARAVEALAYSPDGKTLVSAHRDHSLCVWDAVTNKLVRRFRGPERRVTSIVFAPDGKDFITASKDDCAAVWEVAGGRKASAVQVVGQRLLHVAYSADGQPLAWLADETHVIRQYNVATGAEVRQFRGHTERILAAALSPNGQLLASSSEDKSVTLWDANNGKELNKLKPGQEFDGRKLRPVFEEPIVALKFAPNGWTLFGGTAEQTYYLWDLDNGELLFANNSTVVECHRAMAFSPDGQLLLYSGDGMLGETEEDHKHWRDETPLATFTVLGTFVYRDQEKVTSLAFSPDGARLAAGIADGTVMILDPAKRFGRSRYAPPPSQFVNMPQERFELLWTDLGSPVARKHFEARWNLAETRVGGVAFLKKKLPPARTLALEAVRKLIAELDSDSPDMRAKAYAALEGLGSSIDAELRKTVTARPAPEIKQKVEMLLEAFDPLRMRRGIQVLEQMHSKESRQILQDLAGGAEGAWQTVEARAALKRLASRAERAQPSASPAGPVVAAVGEAKVEIPAKPIKLLERLAPEPAPQPGFDSVSDPLPAGAVARLGSQRMRHRGTANSVLFSLDGKAVISTGADALIRFWDPATGKEQRQFPIAAEVTALSADGKVLFTEGHDMQIVCWDLASGKELGRFSPEIKAAMPFSASPDLRLVICNGTIWEPATGKPWRHQPKSGVDRALAFGEGGKTVILHSEKGLFLHDLTTGAELRQLAGPSRQFVGCSQDGKLLVVRNTESFTIVAMATGKVVREIAGHESIRQFMETTPPPTASSYPGEFPHGYGEEGHGEALRRFRLSVLSADAKTLAVILNGSSEVHLMDLVLGGCRKISMGQQSYITSAAFSADGGLLAVTFADGRVRLWNAMTGQPRLELPRYAVGGGSLVHRLSADGKTLAGYETDGRVGLWDVESGRLRGRMGAVNQMMFDVIWSPRGTKMLSLSANDLETCLWDTADGQLLWRAKRNADRLIGFSNDEKIFAAMIGEDSVKIFAADTGKELRRITTPGIGMYLAALRPDGKTLATVGSDGTARIWSVANGKETGRIEPVQGQIVSALAFSPDGKLLATVGGDGFVSFSDSDSLARIRRFAAPVDLSSFLVFSPDGKLLAARDDSGACSIWDSVTGKQLHRIDAHADEVMFASFTPDSRRAITAGSDGAALVWDLSKLPPPAAPKSAPLKNLAREAKGVLARMGASGSGANVWLANDGRTLISRDGGEAFRLLDVASGKELRRHGNMGNRSGNPSRPFGRGMSSYYYRMAIEEEIMFSSKGGIYSPYDIYRHDGMQTDRLDLSPDGKLLVGWGWSKNAITFWDAVSGDKVNQFIGHPGATGSLVFSPDSKLIATSGVGIGASPYGYVGGLSSRFSYGGEETPTPKDATIRIWEVPSGRIKQTLLGHKTRGAQLAFSPDGKYLLSSGTNPTVTVPGYGKVYIDGALPANGSQDHTIMMWDLTTGKLVRNTRIPAVWTQFSPDGRTIAYHSGDNLFLWDMFSDKFLPRPQVKRGHCTCIFSRDGKTIATASQDDMIRWWDVATGKELGSIDELGAYFVGFTHDAKMLVTTKGSAVRTWDLTTRQEVRPSEGHREPVTALALAPDKRTLISGSGDATVRVWDVKTSKEIRCLTGHKEAITHVAYAPNSRWFASADQSNTVIIWDAVTGKENRRFANPTKLDKSKPDAAAAWAAILSNETQFEWIAGLMFSADCKSLIAVNRMAGVWKWDVETGKKTSLIQGSAEAASNRGTNGFGLSPNGRWLGTAEMTQIQVSEELAVNVGMIRIWDVNTGKVARTIMGSEERFNQIAFSPDGKLVMAQAANVSRDHRYYAFRESGRLRIWEVETGQEIRSRPLSSNAAFGFSFHGDGLLTSPDSASLAFWDLAAGQERLRPTGLEAGGYLTAVVYSTDGSCLVAASDRAIVVLDARAPAMLQQLWPAAATPRPLEDLWHDLAGDPAHAYEAIHFLAVDPAQSVPFLAQRLKPAAVPLQERLQKLLKELDDNLYSVRQAAERELEMLEEQPGPPLREHIYKGSLSHEALGRAERLLTRLESGPSTEQLRHLRALTVLVRIGTPQARAVLQSLADGAVSSRLTREAKYCLERFHAQE